MGDYLLPSPGPNRWLRRISLSVGQLRRVKRVLNVFKTNLPFSTWKRILTVQPADEGVHLGVNFVAKTLNHERPPVTLCHSLSTRAPSTCKPAPSPMGPHSRRRLTVRNGNEHLALMKVFISRIVDPNTWRPRCQETDLIRLILLATVNKPTLTWQRPRPQHQLIALQ